MKKSKSITLDLQNEENDISSIRPLRLDDFIGQKELKENLKVYIEASKARSEVLDHIIFYGPPGLGKTTLSEIIANEVGSQIKVISGPTISKAGDLGAILNNLNEQDVLFIDEIHRLNISVEEKLYSAMEDFKFDILIGEGPSAKSLRIDVPKFTLVGATTRYGLLSNPLRDRFGISFRLDFYAVEDLQSIILRSSNILNIEIEKQAALEIAKRSRGTPRIANSLLKRVRDFLTLSPKKIIDKELVNEVMLKLKIDDNGLDELDIKYLKVIAEVCKGGPVGIGTIASILSEDKGSIEEVIEPFLLKEGLLSKTPKGRVITEKAFKILGLPMKIKTVDTIL